MIPWNKGRKLSKSHCKALSKAHMGQICSEETREKMSRSQKTRIRTEEHYEKVSETLRGHSVSRKTREKIRQSLKGRRNFHHSRFMKKEWKANRNQWIHTILKAQKIARTVSSPNRLERAFAKILKRLDLKYKFEPAIAGFFPDFVVKKFVFETDGDYWHANPKTKKKDRKKDRALRRLGYKVIHFSESEVKRDPERVSDKVRALLDGNS